VEYLRQIRKEYGWSQERTAAEAGIDRVTLVHIETGKSSPTVDTLKKLAGALGLEVADFFPRAQSALFPLSDPSVGPGAATLADGAARVLSDWTDALRERAEEARFRWRREAAKLERPEHLDAALTLHREVQAEARGFYQQIMDLMRAWDREVASEAPERKAELASVATALKEASDTLWNVTQTLLEKLEAQQRADEEEIREIAAREFGVILEQHLKENRAEADETVADLHRIEVLRAQHAG
jgi:transcriptional regulator with XRE-family HTH domain